MKKIAKKPFSQLSEKQQKEVERIFGHRADYKNIQYGTENTGTTLRPKYVWAAYPKY